MASVLDADSFLAVQSGSLSERTAEEYNSRKKSFFRKKQTNGVGTSNSGPSTTMYWLLTTL